MAHRQFGVKMEKVLTLSFIDQFAKIKIIDQFAKIKKKIYRISSNFFKFLNLEKIESYNLCGAQVLRDENGKCYNLVIY